GKTVAAGSVASVVALWDVTTGKRLATLSGHKKPIESLAFSPDGKTLITGDGSWRQTGLPGDIKWWDVAQRMELASFSGNGGCIFGVAFAPNGTTCATGGGDGIVRLWRLPAPPPP